MTRNLYLTPTKSPFDVDTIRVRLDAQPDVFLDPLGTGTYLLCGIPEAVPARFAERVADPSRFPYLCLLRVAPKQVQVDQEYADTYGLRSAMEFMRWLWNDFEFTIREDGGADYTDLVRREGIEALYPPEVRTMPLPWEDRLIKIGFFRDLDHGDISDFALEDRTADAAAPDEERLANYLASGHLYRESTETARDMLADDPDDAPIGPAHLLTDGRYVWPADLAYYVRRYHVRLPPAFVIHVRKNDFRSPSQIDVDHLTMFE